MHSIFSDDAPLDAKRETALKQMCDTLPVAYRIPLRPQLRLMVKAMDEQQLAQLTEDIERGQTAAQAGDMDTIMEIARHWASDDQIREYLPMAESMLKTEQA